MRSRSTVWLTMLLFIGCATVPISGRKQVNLYPESTMIEMSLAAYSDFLSGANVVGDYDKNSKMVQEVGARISAAVEEYMKEIHQINRIKGFQWEFNLVDDPNVNAWCMPGGKVVFYSGIMPVCQNAEGVAVVMGHEIAHAVARHGNERMSQGVLINGGGMALDVLLNEKPDLTRDILLQSYGIGSALGSLAYSRKHESEADKLGMVFMAIAGYDPRTASDFWKRMSEGGGAQPPEFLSTHPSHETRIADIEAFLPEALTYYKEN